MTHFPENLTSWPVWHGVSGSIEFFEPLLRRIFGRHALPYSRPERSMQATNAVFKIGDSVVKIYMPNETGGDLDLQNELFGLRRAEAAGLQTQAIRASGVITDGCSFPYLVTKYIAGTPFPTYAAQLGPQEKRSLAYKLRKVMDRLHTPAERFNNIDVLFDADRQERWENYPETFKAERRAYIAAHDFGPRVFVHGDPNADNILVTENGLCLIDFGEAVLAPASYEHAPIAADLFAFDCGLLRGYFADETPEEILQTVFDGLLIHDFGGDIVRRFFAPADLRTLGDLYSRLKIKLC